MSYLDTMQEDLRELLKALGLSTAARNASPHEVMVNEIIPEARRLYDEAYTRYIKDTYAQYSKLCVFPEEFVARADIDNGHVQRDDRESH